MIYMALGRGSQVKIGCSINPQRRVWSLGGAKLIWTAPGSFKDERRLHKRYAAYSMNNEWFRIDGSLARRVMKILTSEKCWKLRYRCLSNVKRGQVGSWSEMREKAWNEKEHILGVSKATLIRHYI